MGVYQSIGMGKYGRMKISENVPVDVPNIRYTTYCPCPLVDDGAYRFLPWDETSVNRDDGRSTSLNKDASSKYEGPGAIAMFLMLGKIDMTKEDFFGKEIEKATTTVEPKSKRVSKKSGKGAKSSSSSGGGASGAGAGTSAAEVPPEQRPRYYDRVFDAFNMTIAMPRGFAMFDFDSTNVRSAPETSQNKILKDDIFRSIITLTDSETSRTLAYTPDTEFDSQGGYSKAAEQLARFKIGSGHDVFIFFKLQRFTTKHTFWIKHGLFEMNDQNKAGDAKTVWLVARLDDKIVVFRRKPEMLAKRQTIADSIKMFGAYASNISASSMSKGNTLAIKEGYTNNAQEIVVREDRQFYDIVSNLPGLALTITSTRTIEAEDEVSGDKSKNVSEGYDTFYAKTSGEPESITWKIPSLIIFGNTIGSLVAGYTSFAYSTTENTALIEINMWTGASNMSPVSAIVPKIKKVVFESIQERSKLIVNALKFETNSSVFGKPEYEEAFQIFCDFVERALRFEFANSPSYIDIEVKLLVNNMTARPNPRVHNEILNEVRRAQIQVVVKK
jgi:hypothetical protein